MITVNWIAVASVATACVAIIALIPIIQGWIRRGSHNRTLKARISYELIDFLLHWKVYRERGKIPYSGFVSTSEKDLLGNLEELFPKTTSLSRGDQEKIAVFILNLRQRRGIIERMTYIDKEPEDMDALLVASKELLELLSPSKSRKKKIQAPGATGD